MSPLLVTSLCLLSQYTVCNISVGSGFRLFVVHPCLKVKIENCEFNIKTSISYNPTKVSYQKWTSRCLTRHALQVVKDAKKLVKSVKDLVECGKKMVTDVMNVNIKVCTCCRARGYRSILNPLMIPAHRFKHSLTRAST